MQVDPRSSIGRMDDAGLLLRIEKELDPRFELNDVWWAHKEQTRWRQWVR
jgi:hypothetical protein